MRWMFIAAGLMAAASAISLMGLSGLHRKKHGKGKVSTAATVRRVLFGETGMPVVSFVCQGEELRLPVPREIAGQLQPGDRGVLTYRGSSFVYFVPREELFEDASEAVLPVVS